MKHLCVSGIVAILFFTPSCTKHKGKAGNGNYPDAVARIILNKCSTAGCHNDESKDAAAGLSLPDWIGLMNGGKNGPAVIPFRPEFSTLCFYTNTFDDLGPTLKPAMPLGGTPLTREEYLTIRNWIATGAPDRNGNVFNGKSVSGGRIYIANQLCDVVTVIDAETKLPVRYIDVGRSAAREFPVCVRVSPDQQNWYVTFMASDVIQKYSTKDNSKAGEVSLGTGEWSSFTISPDSRFAYCVDHSSAGRILKMRLSSMDVVDTISGPLFHYPRSAAAGDRYLCVGAEYGNYITVIDTEDSLSGPKQVALNEDTPNNNPGIVDPWVVTLKIGTEHVFAGCAASGKIAEVDLVSGKIVRELQIDAIPTKMVYEHEKSRLWVSCMDDSISIQGHKGSIVVIDAITMQVIKRIKAGYQSNGLALVPDEKYVAVVNSNINAGGPEPHHVTGCAGRSGYVTFVDLETLELLPYKYELAVYPSDADSR